MPFNQLLQLRDTDGEKRALGRGKARQEDPLVNWWLQCPLAIALLLAAHSFFLAAASPPTPPLHSPTHHPSSISIALAEII